MLLRPMDENECWALLNSQRMCVLAVVDGEEPYAVPVFYGVDGDTLILGLSEGRKTRALDSNQRVSIVVTEVRPDGFWQSAQVTGRALTLTTPESRQRAIAALMAHNRRLGGAARDPESAPRPAPGRLVRIENAVVTGRARS